MNIKNIIITTIAILLICSGTASAWLSGYDHRMQIDINNTGDNLTDYQYNFTVDTASLVSAGKMNANGSDCRITDSSDVLQEFWNKTAFNISNTTILVNATSLGNLSNTTHYLYYGNTGASDVSDISTTFMFGNDFGDGSLGTAGVTGIVSNFGSWHGNRASAISGDYAFATMNLGLYSVNISDIENPVVDDYLALGTQTLDIEIQGNYAYVSVLDADKLSVVNISDPSNLVEEGNVSHATQLDQVHGINLSYPYVYCCAYSHGTGGSFTIVDVSTPSNPTIRGTVANDANNYIKGSHDARVVGDYAYLAASNHFVENDGRLTSINISDPDNPFVADSITGNSFHHIADIQIKDNYAYMGSHLGSTTGRETISVNISDPTNMVLADTLSGYNMYIGYIYGDELWGADNRYDYVTVINISDPENMVFVREYTFPGETCMLHVIVTPDGKHAICARHGPTDPEACFYIVNTSVTPTNATGWVIVSSETGDSASATTKQLVMTKGTTEGSFQITNSNIDQTTIKKFWTSKILINNTLVLFLNGDETTPTSGAIYLSFRETEGDLRYYSGGYTTITTGLSADTWYWCEIVPDVSTDTFDIYLYYSNLSEISYTGTHTGCNFRQTTTYLDAFRIQAHDVNDVLTTDNFYIRELTTPEPTSSLGAEEDVLDTNITLAANQHGMLRKNITSAETFSTIAAGIDHDRCYTWWDSTADCWESYRVGYSYNSAKSVPEHDSYFVLMDGTGTTISCSIAAAETIAIPAGYYATYLRESTNKTLTAIKSDMGGNVDNLWAFNPTTGAWTDTGSYSVLPNQGLMVNSSTGFNWDGAVP